MARFIIDIEGMGCENCVKAVTKALTEAGAAVESVEIGKAIAAFDGAGDALKAAIEDVGFDVTGIAEG